MHAWPSVLSDALPLDFISSFLNLSSDSFTLLQAILFRICFIFCSGLPDWFIGLGVLSQFPHEILELLNAGCPILQGSLLELGVVSLLCVELLVDVEERKTARLEKLFWRRCDPDDKRWTPNAHDAPPVWNMFSGDGHRHQTGRSNYASSIFSHRPARDMVI